MPVFVLRLSELALLFFLSTKFNCAICKTIEPLPRSVVLHPETNIIDMIRKWIAGCFLLANTVQAQQPEKILHRTRVYKEPGFYNEQAKLWRKEVSKNPKNAAAWENYYLAIRYSDNIKEGEWATDRTKVMAGIVTDMSKQVPNAIEYIHCKLLNTGFEKGDAETFRLIQRGYAMNPKDEEILEAYINYAELNGQTEKFKQLYQGLNDTHVNDYTIMEFNYNMLMSVDKNGILITWGDNDTYPARILQESKLLRKDITLINASFGAYFPEYLNRVLKQKGIVLSDVFIQKNKGISTMNQFIKSLTLEIAKKYSNIPIFFAITGDTENLFADSLYCTGLANKFSTVRIDNISKLKNNIENRFHLDYLRGGLNETPSISHPVGETFASNYVIPFAMLYKHYKSMGESNERSEFYKGFVMEQAVKAKNEKEMKGYLEN
jgi:hypothetical protein